MPKNAFVLRISPSNVDRAPEALQDNQIIIGWSLAQGLLDPELEWDAFREIIRATYYPDEKNLRSAGSAAGHMWRFIRDMDTGDLVVVPYWGEFYVARIEGAAFHDASKADEDTAYRRPVLWLNNKKAIPRATAKSALISRMKTQGTCANAGDLVNEIEECLDLASRGAVPSFGKDLQTRLVNETLDELRSGRMDSFGFERLIETVMTALGAVETQVVPRREDKGIDIYATFLVAGAFRQVVGVQAKHFHPDPPVGADVVEQLTRGIEEGQEPVTLGMIVTSGAFSEEAITAARAYTEEHGIPIELVDGEQFAKLIIEHGLRNAG